MRRWSGLVLLSLFIGFKTLAIEAVVASTVFYKQEGAKLKPYIEVYWQIAPNSLHFMEPVKGSVIAKVRTDISFMDEYGIVMKEDHYIMQTEEATTIEQARTQNILELQHYTLPAGKYKMRIRLTEVIDTNSTYTYTDTFTISPRNEKPAFSNLQLLDTSFASATENIFTKNGTVQLPLCANFADANRKSLFYYAELYFPEVAKTKGSEYTITVSVTKKPFESTLYKLQKIDTVTNTGVIPVSGKFRIDVLPTGNYYLNIALKADGNTQCSQTLFFQRVNPKPVKLNADTTNAGKETEFQDMQVVDLSATFVSKYTLPQTKAIMKMLLPICTPVEKQSIQAFIDRPDYTYMRYFIYNFWKARNPANPKEAWEEYVQLVKDVNRQFAGTGTPGYESERGIIYLKYGKPDEMVEVQNEQGVYPYEIWSYNVLPQQSNGGMIMFYRPSFMMGDYRVLHSNIKGEIRNTNWRSVLYQTGTANSTMNSRAEQYFPGSK